jgi:hypothetical protein
MVAATVLLLLHIPPEVASALAIVDPAQTAEGPVIAGGIVLTVTTTVATPPDDAVNEMVAVPAAIPVTSPEAEPIVAIVGSALVHTPGEEASVNTMLVPIQAEGLPLIAATELTVTTVVAEQPPTE